MATTQNLYTGDGSTVLFSFTFPYLEESDIFVSIDGTTTTEYSLANATTIQFNTPPASGAELRIFRVTDTEELISTFYPGSTIRAQDLNDDFTQTLYVAQEVQGNTFRPDGTLPMVGDLDLGGFDVVNGGAEFNKTVDLANNRITNVASPVAATDAANRAYVDNRTGGNTEIVSTSYVYYTATQGDTVLASNVGGVPVFAVSEGLEQIYVNGALQQTNVDYTTQSTSQITFTQPLLQDDVVAIHCINNVPLQTSVSPATINYTYPGGVEQTVQSRLEQYVSVKDFGAVGDGVTDDLAAIKSAIATGKNVYFPTGNYYFTNTSGSNAFVIQANQTLFGDGPNSILTQANNDSWIIVDKSNVTIKDLRIVASDPNIPVGIQTGVPAASTPPENLRFENIVFESGLTRIRLGNSNETYVTGCSFINTGYCVLQLGGTIANNITVTNCYSKDCKSDFVEANCVQVIVDFSATSGQGTFTLSTTDSGNTKNRYIPGQEGVTVDGVVQVRGVDYTTRTDGDRIVFNPALSGGQAVQVTSPRTEGLIINNNIFDGSAGYPVAVGPENRFVGVTAVHGVVIDGNIARNCNGDSFVHLEALGGEVVVSNNYFNNLSDGRFVIVTGTLGYTWNLVVTDNIFEQSDPQLTTQTTVLYTGNENDNNLIFTGNRCVVAVGSAPVVGLAIAFHKGDKIINNNHFENLLYVSNAKGSNNLIFNSNRIRNCEAGILATTGTGQNWQIMNNTFEGTTATYDIESRVASPQGYPNRHWFVQGNYFGKGLLMTGSGGPNAAGTMEDVYIYNNVFAGDSTSLVIGQGSSATRVRKSNNTFESTGETGLSSTTATLEPSDTAPATPTAGMMYYDNATNKLKLYNGTSFVDLN